MKKQRNPRATPDEWERRLASILDKSRNSLIDLNAKYDLRSKQNSLALHCCGPHERSAIAAWKVNAPLSRPLSRSSDDDVYNYVEPRISKYVDDKQIVTARAIDAMRDQISNLSSDIHQLANDTTRATKAVSKQERRLDNLSTDFDTRQGTLSDMEKYIENEEGRKSKIVEDLNALLQSAKQQKEELENKTDLVTINSILESFKSETSMSIASAVSPLQTSIKREINSLHARMKEEVSLNIQPFQANLMESVKVAVETETKASIERELERLQGCIESFKKSKGQVKAFVESSVEAAEKNLHDGIETSLKEVKRLQRDVGLLRRNIRDDVATDMATMKEELAQIALKQSELLAVMNSSIESCRSDLSSSMVDGLSEVISAAEGRSKQVDEAVANIRTCIQELQSQHQEDMSRQKEDISNLFQRVIELEANLLKISTQSNPHDDNILSEKLNSIVNAKVEKLDAKIKALENSQYINIKQSEVWHESLSLLQEEESRRRSIRGLLSPRSIDEEEEDKMNISEERNRTLSDVARKVLVVASKRGNDPSLVKLAQRMKSGKLSTPAHSSLNRSSGQVNNYSPSETSISTTEALSICGVKLDHDDEVETPRTESPRPEPFPTRSLTTPSPTQSCLDATLNYTPSAESYVLNRNGSKDNEAMKPRKDAAPLEIDSLPNTGIQVNGTIKQEESDNNSSVEGSITSYDEIIEVTHTPPNKTPKTTGKETGYNPTRLSNPEPYEGWDSLLNELRASGLVLRDGNEDDFPKEDVDDESSSSSYGSASFE